MSKIDFSFIRYSNCWEDTDILLEALDIKEGDIGLSVASAGDNTLAMLLKNPEKVCAFDLNKTQLFCCELKIAAFKLLDYEDILVLLGVNNGDRLALYNKVKCELSQEAREYFNSNIKIIQRGVIHSGKFERFFHIFRKVVVPLFSTRKTFSKFSHISSIDEQISFFDRKINNKRLNFIFKIYFGYKVMGKLGRDKAFYRYVKDKNNSGSDIKGRFEYGVKNTINATNPYFSYIANGNYSEDSLPAYLKKKNFNTIKSNIDKIVLVHGDLLSIGGKFDFFNLSDIFEYMSDSDFDKNADKVANLAKENARIVYWNMQNKRYLNNKKFVFNKTNSDRLYQRNKSWFYRDFLLYERNSAVE